MPRTAIITGGAQGIGRGVVTAFIKEGWNVAFADIDVEAGKELVDALKAEERLCYVPCDVSIENEAANMVDTCVKKYGGVDAVINNAGIGVFKPLADLALDEWNKVLAVNLTSVYLFARHASEHLKRSRGSIVNIASTRALMSEPGTEAYSASKGGIVALTHALAVSMGPEVRVNCISPGWIEVGDFQKKANYKAPNHSQADKKQHPAGRVGVPDDIAQMALYLCSEKAGFITGQNFVIDGGMTKRMIYV